jgi:hypothetical protein
MPFEVSFRWFTLVIAPFWSLSSVLTQSPWHLYLFPLVDAHVRSLRLTPVLLLASVYHIICNLFGRTHGSVRDGTSA